MKTSAIIRIIAWSVVALLLTAVLCVAIIGPSWSFLPSFDDLNWGVSLGGANLTYSDSELYSPVSGPVTLDGIHALNVSWYAGGVSVQPHDENTVSFSETGAETVGEELKMHYYVKDNQVFIRFSKSKTWRVFRFSGKQLTILVPRSLFNEIRISAVSANIELKDISADKMDLESVSGDISLFDVSARNCDVEQVSGRIFGSGINSQVFDAQTVSGKTNVSGSFQEISHEGVSGDAEYASSICPVDADIGTVSGNIRLSIPENQGFTARYDKISGTVSNEFPATSEKNRAVYGDGSAEFSFETVSGNIYISKLP